MEEDAALYKKFSELIQKTIEDFEQKRISDLEYFKRAHDISDQFYSKKRSDIPGNIRDNPNACAYYGVIRESVVHKYIKEDRLRESLSCEMALAIDKI